MNCKLYILEGENEFLIQKEIDLLIKKANLKKEDLEFISYNLLDTNLDNVVEDLDTYNMFLKKKVITVTNPIFLEEKIPDNFPIKSFLKYMKNPSDNILIFITKKVNNRLKLTSEILNYFTLIKIKEISPFAFLKENIQGYKMDSSLISYFLNNKIHFLIFYIIGNIFYALSYIFINALVAGINSCFSIIRCIIIYYIIILLSY